MHSVGRSHCSDTNAAEQSVRGGSEKVYSLPRTEIDLSIVEMVDYTADTISANPDDVTAAAKKSPTDSGT